MFDLVQMTVNERPVIVLYGELDIMGTTRFHDAIAQLADERVPVVLVDMANVSFLDSAGLGALIVADRKLRATEGELRLVAVAPQAARTLEITGLSERFNLFRDIDTASE